MYQEVGLKFCLDTENNRALPLDLACPECLSVWSPANLPLYNHTCTFTTHIVQMFDCCQVCKGSENNVWTNYLFNVWIIFPLQPQKIKQRKKKDLKTRHPPPPHPICIYPKIWPKKSPKISKICQIYTRKTKIPTIS